MPGFLPPNRVRSLAGAALALLLAIACAPAEATAGCHRDVDGGPAGLGPALENLRSVGALATPPGRVDAPAATVLFGDRREGCTGPLCSSNSDPVSAPTSSAPAPLQTEWMTIEAPLPPPDPTAAPAAPGGRAPWTNPPLVGVFHPPRRPSFVG